MRHPPQALLAAVGLLLSTYALTPALAQPPAGAPASTRYYATVIRLKPEMVKEWTDLQKVEVIPAMKKAGVTSRTVLSTVVGNAFEYVTLTPFPTFAAMDGDGPLVKALGVDGAAKLNAKVRRCILTQQSYMTNRQDELSVPQGDALVWRTTVRRALPGKVDEYLASYRSDVLPAMKQAKADGKIAGSSVAVRGVGAMSGELTTVVYYDKFGDMEAGNPVVLVLGKEANDRIAAKAAALAPATQTVIRRRVADLSY